MTFALTAVYLSMTAVLGIVFFDRATRKTPNSTDNSTTTTTGPANLTSSSTPERTLTSDGSSTWYFQLQWLLINMASPFAWVVTVVFFVFIYDGGVCVPLEDVNIHILNLVWVLLDHVVRALPVRMSHVYQVSINSSTPTPERSIPTLGRSAPNMGSSAPAHELSFHHLLRLRIEYNTK